MPSTVRGPLVPHIEGNRDFRVVSNSCDADSPTGTRPVVPDVVLKLPTFLGALAGAFVLMASGEARAGCIEGTIASCVGSGGCTGEKECLANGTWGACSCAYVSGTIAGTKYGTTATITVGTLMAGPSVNPYSFSVGNGTYTVSSSTGMGGRMRLALACSVPGGLRTF